MGEIERSVGKGRVGKKNVPEGGGVDGFLRVM